MQQRRKQALKNKILNRKQKKQKKKNIKQIKPHPLPRFKHPPINPLIRNPYVRKDKRNIKEEKPKIHRTKPEHFELFKERTKSASPVYVACKWRSDGSCAQAMAQIHVMIMAHSLGMTFVYIPFRTVAHFDERKTGIEWVKDWDKLFNLDKNELTLKQANPNKYFHHKSSKSVLPMLREKKYHHKGLYSFRDALNYVEYFHEYLEDSYKYVIQKVKDRYNPPNVSLIYDTSVFNVAIHIRRGDVLRVPNKFIPNEYFLRLMTQLNTMFSVQKVQKAQKVHYHVFSDGKKGEFPEFNIGDNTFLHLDDEIPAGSTLHHLIKADMLIMSKSKFSFYAGLVTEGIVIYTPYFMSAPKCFENDWVKICDETEGFTNEQLESICERVCKSDCASATPKETKKIEKELV